MIRACLLGIVLFACMLPIAVAEDLPTPGVAHINVASTPSDAEVFLNGNYIGKTPLNYQYMSLGQPVRLQLLLKGYLPYDYSTNSGPDAGSTLDLNAWLIPSAASASLAVHSNPSGALVTLNNGQAQNTPWTYTNLVPGKYLVHVEYFGFAAYTGYVELTAGQTVTLSVPLVLQGVSGSLQVSSVPAGAAVFIDGFSYGKTNKAIGNLAPGTHAVLLQYPGYEDWYGTAEILPGVASYLTAELSS